MSPKGFKLTATPKNCPWRMFMRKFDQIETVHVTDSRHRSADLQKQWVATCCDSTQCTSNGQQQTTQMLGNKNLDPQK